MRSSILFSALGAITPLLAAAGAPAPGQPRASVHSVAELLDAKPVDKPVSLHVRICFASPGHPAPLCREVALTPGAAGAGFDSIDACEGAKARALDDWFRQAKDVFGFTTGWSGSDYLITDPRCVAV